MPSQSLYAAVARFAAAMHAQPDWVLNSDAWSDGAYAGVRYAYLHTMLQLRQLAVQLLAERTLAGNARTEAQHALAQHHAAFRDLEALLLGVTPELYRRLPTGPTSTPASRAALHP